MVSAAAASYVSCPPRAKHVIVGAGTEPALVVAVGARKVSQTYPFGQARASRAPRRAATDSGRSGSANSAAVEGLPARAVGGHRVSSFAGWLFLGVIPATKERERDVSRDWICFDPCGQCARRRRVRRQSRVLRALHDRRGSGVLIAVATRKPRQRQHRNRDDAVPPGGPQRRSLFASMSNHMAKSVICRPAISSTATSTIVGVVISFPAIRRTASMTPRMKPADVMSTPKT